MVSTANTAPNIEGEDTEPVTSRPAPQAQDSPQAMEVDVRPAMSTKEETKPSTDVSAPEKSEGGESKCSDAAMDIDKGASADVVSTSPQPVKAEPIISINTQSRSPITIPPKSPDGPTTRSEVSKLEPTLEQLYRPYVLPDETDLDSARDRIRNGLEQTRVLRQAFTEQVYERYGVILKPFPSTREHADELEKLLANPHESMSKLAAIDREKKRERDRVRLEEGENDPLATFGGDGLHLVILPEEQPQLFDKGLALSQASAAAAEGLLDRVRRIRGYEIPQKEYVQRAVDRSLNSSPSLSIDSNFGMPQVQLQQRSSRKAGYSSMLTLTPEGETLQKGRKYNASQMALISKGVGVSEMKLDPRIGSSLVMHQRVIPKEFYETILPPLLGARQVGKMEIRKVHARKAIRSVIREIMEKEENDLDLEKASTKNDCNGKSKKGGSDDKDGSSGGGGPSELGLLHRLSSIAKKQRESKSSSDHIGDKSDSGGKSDEGAANLAIDPILAYSVMSAVGLVNEIDTEEYQKPSDDEENLGNPIAKTLGLSKLMNLSPVSAFVDSFAPTGRENKRKIADDNGQKQKKAKIDTAIADGKEGVLHIRGGGGDEEEKDPKNNPGKPTNQQAKRESSNSVTMPSNLNLSPTMQGQLLQQQSLLQSTMDPYRNAALAQLGLSMGTFPSQPTSDLSDYILRSQLDSNLLPGQLNYSQDAVTAMLLREQTAAIQYQAALTSLAAQNQFAAYSRSANSIRRSGAGTSRSPINLDPVIPPLQRKRSKSHEDITITNPPKRSRKGRGKGKQTSPKTSPLPRPSSAPAQPAPMILPKAVDPSKDPPQLPKVTGTKAQLHFTPPEAPKGISSEVVQLILDAKFHEAYALKPDQSELMIEFLQLLARAVPISEKDISDMLTKKLVKHSLKEFLDESNVALRDVIVATIIICLWNKNESYYKQFYVEAKELRTVNPNCNEVISFAVEKGLHALSSYSESQSSSALEMPKGQIASIINISLMKRVTINKQMDAALPIIDDMQGLLDTLRMEALKAKVQERVLLATLVSRHGKMSEAFSNAYVSSIIRAGEALGHEDVCEIAQDEKCRASTMLPYDFFHDHTGLWEEPCRPQTAVHPDTSGKELKRRAHAKSVIQKSMRKLQDCLGLEGGIKDGGPYFSSSTDAAVSSPASSPTAKEAVLVRTNSSSLKRKGSHNWDTTVLPGIGMSGVPDSIFNPGHWVEPMMWDSSNTANTPYGRHQVGLRPSIYSVGGSLSESKWNQLKAFPQELQNRSTHEIKWEDIADMFLHGGSTREIVLDLGGSSSSKKKKIIAPFVRSFDISSLKVKEHDEHYSEEDISDETILRRHQSTLDEMQKKISALTEMKQQQPQPGRGRKKQL